MFAMSGLNSTAPTMGVAQGIVMGVVQDTCKKWSQGRGLRGARTLRDFTDDSTAGSTCDFRPNLPNAEIRGRGQRLDFVDNVLLCPGTPKMPAACFGSPHSGSHTLADER
jgi:hypothetical protein